MDVYYFVGIFFLLNLILYFKSNVAVLGQVANLYLPLVGIVMDCVGCLHGATELSATKEEVTTPIIDQVDITRVLPLIVALKRDSQLCIALDCLHYMQRATELFATKWKHRTSSQEFNLLVYRSVQITVQQIDVLPKEYDHLSQRMHC